MKKLEAMSAPENEYTYEFVVMQTASMISTGFVQFFQSIQLTSNNPANP